MSEFEGDYISALWAIATGTTSQADCVNAEIMRGIAKEALGQKWRDFEDQKRRADAAFGVLPDSPVQPVEEAAREVNDTAEVDPFEGKDPATLAAPDGPYATAEDLRELGLPNSFEMNDEGDVIAAGISPSPELPNGHSGVWNHTEYGKQD